MDEEKTILRISRQIHKLDILDDFSNELKQDILSSSIPQIIIKKCAMKSFYIFCKYIIRIKDKQNKIKRKFILHNGQINIARELILTYNSKGYIKASIMKGRQAGASTLTSAFIFWLYFKTIDQNERENLEVLIISQTYSSIKTLIKEKVREMFEDMEEDFKHYFLDEGKTKLIKDNECEIIFNKHLRFVGVSADSKTVGRSGSFNIIWGSETGYYSMQQIEGALGTISTDGTVIIFESTANGIGNCQYSTYKMAMDKNGSKWTFIFDPWWNMADYSSNEGKKLSDFALKYRETYNPNLTDQQLEWLDYKFMENGENIVRLNSEFPPNPEIAFETSNNKSNIKAEYISRAFANENPLIPDYVPIVLGIDIGFNNDKTVIALKRGTYIEIYDDFIGIDTGNIVNRIYSAIIDLSKNLKIAHVNIDSVGVGRGVFDDIKRMIAYSHHTISINMINGGAAVDNPKYRAKNLNALLLYKFQEWVENPESKIKSNAQLSYELFNLKSDFTENGTLFRIDKEEAKKIGGKSPDYADAVLYTFAYDIPSHMFDPVEQRRREEAKANKKSWNSGSVFDNW